MTYVTPPCYLSSHLYLEAEAQKAKNRAKEIGMEPVPVLKEKAGYLLNSLLVPFLLCAMDLYANGVSDPASIDKAWKISTSSPQV